MKPLTIGIWVVIASIALPIGCSIISTTNSVTTAPGRVVRRTLQTDNIIGNYELFFDLKAQFDVRTAQVRQQQAFLDAESDPDERRRLRMELAAMQQSCRDLAAQYNANSEKLNRDVFKSQNLPESLTCAS